MTLPQPRAMEVAPAEADFLPDGFDWLAPDYEAVYNARIARVRAIRDGSVDPIALSAFYAERPVHFIADWGMTFDPRLAEDGRATTIPFLLFQRQIDFVIWLHERLAMRQEAVCEKSRDMGVSWLCVAYSVWLWLFRQGSVVGFGSRKETYVDDMSDPKSLLWKVRMFIRMLPQELRPLGYNEKKHAPFMRIANPETGSIIFGEAGDNIGRGARATLYIVDEAAHLERADVIDAALSGTSNCKIWVSSVNGTGNLFHRKRMSGRYPVFVFDWSEDPRKGRDWYEAQKRMLEPHVLAQEVDRDYTAAVTDSFIRGDIVTQASQRGPFEVLGVGPIIIGVDCARFGDDKSVVVIRQGRLCSRVEAWGKADIVDTAGRVKDIVKAMPDPPDQIAVDTIGIGAGVADILRRDFGDIVVDVNSSVRLDDGENYNLRARMWRDMRDWLDGNPSIPADAELVTDMTSLRYSYRDSRLLMESKDDAKKRGIKSPDRADALALTFAVPVRKRAATPVNTDLNPAWAVIDEMVGW